MIGARFRKNLLILLACSLSQFALAETENNWKNYGYYELSYNHLSQSPYFTSLVYNRVFDINPDGITLHQISYTLSYLPKEGLGFLFNPNLGRDMFVFAPYGWNPDIGWDKIAFAIPQMFIQYGVDKLTLSAGQFFALVGAEYLDPLKNTNFSRSILWGFAEPYTVMGLRAAYAFNDKLTLYVGGNNGWDNIRDTSRGKTLELSSAFTPNKIFSLSLSGYFGQQRAADKTDYGVESFRRIFDIVATLNLSDKLSIVANYDYASQNTAALPDGILGQAVWQGLAGYINYKFNDKWRASLRGEIFDDEDGYRTGVLQEWKELTLTIGYTLAKNMEIRGEARHDFSNVASFLKKNYVDLSNHQQSFAIELAAQFL